MAQLAAVAGALGAALLLLARGRLTLIGGLALLALAEVGQFEGSLGTCNASDHAFTLRTR